MPVAKWCLSDAEQISFFELAVKKKCKIYHDWAPVEQGSISLQLHFSYMSPGYDAECCSTVDCFGSGIYPAT